MGSYLYSSNRVKLFKYFFSEKPFSERKDEKVDHFTSACYCMDILADMFPTEKITVVFPSDIEQKGLVGFEKIKYLRLLRHFIPHVPEKAAR